MRLSVSGVQRSSWSRRDNTTIGYDCGGTIRWMPSSLTNDEMIPCRTQENSSCNELDRISGKPEGWKAQRPDVRRQFPRWPERYPGHAHHRGTREWRAPAYLTGFRPRDFLHPSWERKSDLRLSVTSARPVEASSKHRGIGNVALTRTHGIPRHVPAHTCRQHRCRPSRSGRQTSETLLCSPSPPLSASMM